MNESMSTYIVYIDGVRCFDNPRIIGVDTVELPIAPFSGQEVSATQSFGGFAWRTAPKTNFGDGKKKVFHFRSWELAGQMSDVDGAFADGRAAMDHLMQASSAPDLVRSKFSHYFKPCPYDHVDVYRVLELFGVTSPSLQHAVKKLLVAGGRGAKNIDKDIQEAIDALTRFQEMRAEDAAAIAADSDFREVATNR